MKLLFFALSAVLSASALASDASRNESEEMNTGSYAADRTRQGGVKIAFLGNSITLHEPLASIGWTNSWGMAASGAEKDYVHLVTDGIAAATKREPSVMVRNIAALEREFRTVNVTNLMSEVVAFGPEYVIVAIGENVPDLVAEADRLAYRRTFEALLAQLMPGRVKPNVVVRGVFWPNAAKDFEMAHAASDFAVPFVRADIAEEPGMRATGLFAHPGVAAHPSDAGMAEIAARILEGFFPTVSGYEAWADGRPVKVMSMRVSAVPFNQLFPGYQRPVEQTEVAGFATVESEGPVSFRVRPARKFTCATVRPLSAGVKPAVSGGEVLFTVPRCGHYVLEIDGLHSPLELFVEPKRDFAAERAAATLSFGPGLHEPVLVNLKDHDRVYIDKDAVVKACFRAKGVKDVKIFGYGVIDGSRNRRTSYDCYRDDQDSGIQILDSSDITVDGPVVANASAWCVSAFNSSNLEFAHLKVTGAWRYNTDGIDICNSRNVRVRDSYFHSFDDSIVVKGLISDAAAPVEDVRVERCVCWCGWGRTLEVGLETWAPYMRGIAFEDCDLIHNNHGAISVHLGGPAPVEGLTFRNLRLEYDASERPSVMQRFRDEKYISEESWSGDVITVTNYKMFGAGSMYGEVRADEPHGTVRDLLIENVNISVGKGAKRPRFDIHAEEGTAFGNITIRGVSVNGREERVGLEHADRLRRRGVMLPDRPCTGDDFRTLHEWGATLVRYQMVRNWGKEGDNRDVDEYARWLDGKLDHLEGVVLPMALKYGMKVVVDLHVAPGGRTDNDLNMFYEKAYGDCFVECWRKIARRFKGREGIYGYDLINEPNQRSPCAPDSDYWSLQRRAADAVREIDPDVTIVFESNGWAAPSAFEGLKPLGIQNVVYQAHMYLPMDFTHQLVPGMNYRASRKYPDPDAGFDCEFLRKALEPVRSFQLKYGARIYIGEFSAVAWADGAENYIADCISLFEEYGWDWSYHAFREWPGWSVETTSDKPEGPFVPSLDNPRKAALLKGLRARR